jgi:hypothetical protein
VCQGLHDSLRQSHGKESVRAAPVGLVVLHESDRNHVSNGGFSTIYRHELSAHDAYDHSASRARIIAGLSGFLTLSQSREGPDR